MVSSCRRAKQVSNTFTSSPFVAHPERMATANRGRGWFVVVLLVGRCAGISAVKISSKLRIKIVRSSDGFRPRLVQLSDNSRPQNHLTALDVRRAVWNGACYVRPLPWQGEQRPSPNRHLFAAFNVQHHLGTVRAIM